jgi:sporulation protein YlmC with PRC-barrel domain
MLRLVLAVLFAVGLLSPAQALTQEQIVRELIGKPVYSMDGKQVGTVADIALGHDKELETLMMNTDRSLGFGERTVKVPGSVFIALRGSIVLDLPAASMDVLIEHGETVSN